MQMFSLKSDHAGNSESQPNVNVRSATTQLPKTPRESEPRPRELEPKMRVPSEETIISNDITIEGNVTSVGKVRLEGTVEGDMRCRSVTVGEKGSVTGSIVAEEVAVYGRVSGTVEGKSVTLYKTAHVEGDIVHQGIGIEMGTHYDGRLKWGGERGNGRNRPQAQIEPVIMDPSSLSELTGGHSGRNSAEASNDLADPFAAHRRLAMSAEDRSPR